jgi:hypothetical protein
MFFLMSFSFASSIALVGDLAGTASEFSGSIVGSEVAGLLDGLAWPLSLAVRRNSSVPVPVKNAKNLRLVSAIFTSLCGPPARIELASDAHRPSSNVILSLPKKR